MNQPTIEDDEIVYRVMDCMTDEQYIKAHERDTAVIDRIEAIREAAYRVCGIVVKPRDLVELEFKTIETRTPRDSALLAICDHVSSANPEQK